MSNIVKSITFQPHTNLKKGGDTALSYPPATNVFLHF